MLFKRNKLIMFCTSKVTEFSADRITETLGLSIKPVSALENSSIQCVCLKHEDFSLFKMLIMLKSLQGSLYFGDASLKLLRKSNP